MRYQLVNLVVVASISLVTACGINERDQTSTADLQISGDTVPSTWQNRSIDCETPNKPQNRNFKSGLLKGRKINYKSSSQIDYNNTDWPYLAASSWNALSFIDQSTKVAVIDIRNVNGVPHYHYFSNGTWNSLNQNWSSTKTLAQIGFIHKMRLATKGEIGREAYILDPLLGEDYKSFHYLSYRLHDDSWNNAGGIFKHLIGMHPINSRRMNPTSFVRGWLARPAELFNGYYGVSSFRSRFDIRNGSKTGPLAIRLEVPTKPNSSITPNSLSPLTLAESWKRLGVNFRDQDLLPKGIPGDDWQSYRYDGSGKNLYAPENINNWQVSITKKDLEAVFYGPNPNIVAGALHDIGIRGRFTQAFGGDKRLDQATQGKWRIFGKTGAGRNNRAYGAYVCLPEFLGGREFAFFVLSPKGVAGASKAVEQIVDSFAPGLRSDEAIPSIDHDL